MTDHTASDDEQLIRDLIETWHRATAAADLDQLLKLMAEDVVFLVTGQAPMRGRDAFALAFRAAVQRFRINSHSYIEEVQVAGEWAYCWSRLSVVLTPLRERDDAPVVHSGYTLSILRRTAAGDWVISRDANMLTSQPLLAT